MIIITENFVCVRRFLTCVIYTRSNGLTPNPCAPPNAYLGTPCVSPSTSHHETCTRATQHPTHCTWPVSCMLGPHHPDMTTHTELIDFTYQHWTQDKHWISDCLEDKRCWLDLPLVYLCAHQHNIESFRQNALKTHLLWIKPTFTLTCVGLSIWMTIK